jgi:hypothetical protein
MAESEIRRNKMMKEELRERLRKESTYTVQWEHTQMINRPSFVNGYITGAEPREKRIKDLEAQLEKMKNKNEESDAVLAAGSTFNKALNSMNKALEEERDKYRNMVFDKDEQLTKAKDLIENIIRVTWGEGWNYSLDWKVKAEQYLKDLEK